MLVSIILFIVAILIILFLLRNRYELRNLATTRYELHSDKIKPEDSVKVVFMADLHSRIYGDKNKELIERIAAENPDAILFAGDIVTSSRHPDYSENRNLFHELLKIAPIYYGKGNHEKKMSLSDSPACEKWWNFQREMEQEGIQFLDNRMVPINESITVTGLDIDFRYYNKIKREFYPPEQMKKDLAEADGKRFNIVLAHNPRFFRTYAESGRDLFLSGHYHGGAVRLFGKIGVISPQFRLFPRYSKGCYHKGDSTMIVTGGCGSHKVNLRIHNRPEVVVITLNGNLV